MTISSNEATRIIEAQVIGRLPTELRITIDTRRLVPGETYLALRGTRFDGHAFIERAFRQGAAAAIVDTIDQVPSGLPALLVKDTFAALLSLAALARRHFCGAIVGITGSTGKTTTKALLAELLCNAQLGGVAATPENENNEIGVSKLLLHLSNEATAIVEMGARHVGDIATLTSIVQPHVAILTNTGEAHLEIFGSREALIREKRQIFSTGSRPILGIPEPIDPIFYASLKQTPYFFGIDQEHRNLPAQDIAGAFFIEREHVLFIDVERRERRFPYTITIPGDHNRRNLAAASAAAWALGLTPERLVEALQCGVQLPNGRYQRHQTASGITIIDDAYNASPSGMIASLATFAREPGRHIIVLGSMAELGESAASEHRRVGTVIGLQRPALLLVGGQHASDVASAAHEAGLASEAIRSFSNNEEAIAVLRSMLHQGDTVFIKGSRLYHLEEIVDALLAMAQPSPEHPT